MRRPRGRPFLSSPVAWSCGYLWGSIDPREKEGESSFSTLLLNDITFTSFASFMNRSGANLSGFLMPSFSLTRWRCSSSEWENWTGLSIHSLSSSPTEHSQVRAFLLRFHRKTFKAYYSLYRVTTMIFFAWFDMLRALCLGICSRKSYLFLHT